jgi:hypothetical protein
MRTWAVASFFALLSCAEAFAQVSATFYLDKNVIHAGETAILSFKVTNLGPSPYLLETTGLPNFPACSGYNVKVLRQPDSATRPKWVLANTCVISGNGQFHYMSVAPGATYVQNIDLSLYLDLRVRGEYIIEVSHRAMPWSGDLAKATAELTLRVE